MVKYDQYRIRIIELKKGAYYCFEAKTYEEFLDRYLEIVPDYSFGLGKNDLLPDSKLKKFLGY